MGFDRDLKAYRDNKNLEFKFLNESEIIIFRPMIIKTTLNNCTPIDKDYGLINAECSFNYKKEDDFIYDLDVEDFGLCFDDIYTVDTFEDYYNLTKNNEYPLSRECNDATIKLDKFEYSNINKDINFQFYYEGESNELYIMEYHNFTIVVTSWYKNTKKDFHFTLLLDAIELRNEKKYDLSFLVFFSSIDSYINILAEDLEKKYYSEINLKKLEFKSKLSLVLKENINISKSQENFPVRELILKRYSDIYDLRNKVAHGVERNITYENCEQCFELFIMIYYAIQNKALTPSELLKTIKE